MAGNLENVGFSLEGHEGLYNIFMMEEIHTIFAVGAGAVTKLVDSRNEEESGVRITRIFNAKYPDEYLREIEKRRLSDGENKIREKILDFFQN